MKAAFLSDRGVVKVTGDDARKFLNNLVTGELDGVKPGIGKFAALLTPQGKIVVDFIVTEAPAGHGGGLLLDCPRALAGALATKLGFYKLRAKVAVENLSDQCGVMAVWDGVPSMLPDLAFSDPRHADMGLRVLIPSDLSDTLAKAVGANMVDEREYDAHRIACGVPRGGIDFTYGDAFPHDVNMDRMHGVDFDKGCYIGQEVVSRMQHRGTARTRITRLTLGGASPEPGADVLAAGKTIGMMGSSANGRALALLRLDKVADALAADQAMTAGGLALRLVDNADAVLPPRKATI